MSSTTPRVSVVIPTRRRPALLHRALASVIGQTEPSWEAIVVVDGSDPESERVLREQTDTRIRCIVNPQSVGGSAARNQGIRAATGDWIALLDDDDEWLPERLARHLTQLPPPDAGKVLGFCRTIVRAPHGDYLWPRRAPAPMEQISDFLFARRSWFAGEGGIQTSAIVAPRSLFLAVPFDETLPRYQDTDWVLRACAAGAQLQYTSSPLSIWYHQEARPTIGRAYAKDWQYSLEWIRARRHLVTRRAYASFLLIRGGDLTAAALSPRGALAVAREAFLHGRPSLLPLLVFGGKWIVPARARRRLRAAFSRSSHA
jgi:glycosyltransferase involved in cell wall biosynthesis